IGHTAQGAHGQDGTETVPFPPARFTTAGQYQGAWELRPLTDVNGLLVTKRALATTGVQQFPTHRIVGDGHFHPLLHHEGDDYHELVQALNELPGAVDWIDNPDVVTLQTGGIIR